jgi:hypothetical protein
MSSKPNPSRDTVPLNVQFTFTAHGKFYMFLCLRGRPDTESMPVAKALPKEYDVSTLLLLSGSSKVVNVQQSYRQ